MVNPNGGRAPTKNKNTGCASGYFKREGPLLFFFWAKANFRGSSRDLGQAKASPEEWRWFFFGAPGKLQQGNQKGKHQEGPLTLRSTNMLVFNYLHTSPKIAGCSLRPWAHKRRLTSFVCVHPLKPICHVQPSCHL